MLPWLHKGFELSINVGPWQKVLMFYVIPALYQCSTAICLLLWFLMSKQHMSQIVSLLSEMGTDGFSAGVLDGISHLSIAPWEKLKEWKHWYCLKSTRLLLPILLLPVQVSIYSRNCWVTLNSTSPSPQQGHLPVKPALFTPWTETANYH